MESLASARALAAPRLLFSRLPALTRHASRNIPIQHDAGRDRLRHAVERNLRRVRVTHGIAARHDKTARDVLAAVRPILALSHRAGWGPRPPSIHVSGGRACGSASGSVAHERQISAQARTPPPVTVVIVVFLL